MRSIKYNVALCQVEVLLVTSVLRRPMKRHSAKERKILFVFVDLEKVLDWLPKRVIYYALNKVGVREDFVKMLKDCRFCRGCVVRIFFCRV